MSACRTFPFAGERPLFRALYYLQKNPFANYAAIRFLKRHIESFFAPAPTDLKAEASSELTRAIEKSGLADCTTAEHEERIYRSHNVCRTSVKRDSAGIGVVSSPNDPDQQCGCDTCRDWRRKNSRTGVARKGREI